MTPVERSAYLVSLGLVDWQLRVAVEEAAATEAGVGTENASAHEASTLEPQAQSDQQRAPRAMDDVAGLDWTELENWLAGRDRRGAQRPVFGTGARDADLLIVGEAPGAQEDRQGLPFVGPAGKLLDRMLAAIDCSRERNVYITNICKFRPPNNRDPRADEVAADWPVLERQIELMNPRLVVAVGRIAAQTLLGCGDSLRALRGRVHHYPQRDLPVVVTYHPAYLLRTPQDKAKSWADLKRIAAMLCDNSSGDAAP